MYKIAIMAIFGILVFGIVLFAAGVIESPFEEQRCVKVSGSVSHGPIVGWATFFSSVSVTTDENPLPGMFTWPWETGSVVIVAELYSPQITSGNSVKPELRITGEVDLGPLSAWLRDTKTFTISVHDVPLDRSFVGQIYAYENTGNLFTGSRVLRTKLDTTFEVST